MNQNGRSVHQTRQRQRVAAEGQDVLARRYRVKRLRSDFPMDLRLRSCVACAAFAGVEYRWQPSTVR